MKSISHAEIKAQVKNAPGDIVSGLISEGSVNISVGDSGLGKTAFFVQQGLCVASGIPFLGQAVRKGRVLWLDYENGLSSLDILLDTLTEHLQLPDAGPDFRILQQPSRTDVIKEIAEFKPLLVCVDALRGYDPRAEADNTAAGEMITKCQTDSARSPGMAWQFIHHIKKQQNDSRNTQVPLIQCDSVLNWLIQAAGARALINQTATRIGIDSYSGTESGVELILRGHYKLRGGFGPWFIARSYDIAGEPIGYHRVYGRHLLSQAHRSKFDLLPPTFSFSEAAKVYGNKNGKPVVDWLKKCQSAGLLDKTGRGRLTEYRKTALGIGDVQSSAQSE